MTLRQTIKAYYYLTKPGIVYGNSLTAIAGYLFAAGIHGSFATFAAMLVGVCAVMASACVFNNVIDRDIDARMDRTKKRALVQKTVRVPAALAYGSTLLAVGALLLGYGTNLVTLAVALFGFVAYVGLYTYTKRITVHSTLIGTLSGATPPVIGYAAATGSLDLTALLLFIILVVWQMPHFYAIAIFRRSDYASANIPVLSVVKGVEATRRQIIVYILLFLVVSVSLGVFGGMSLLSTMIVLLAGWYWLYLSLQQAPDGDMSVWARSLFRWSLMLLLALCASLSLDSFFL